MLFRGIKQQNTRKSKKNPQFIECFIECHVQKPFMRPVCSIILFNENFLKNLQDKVVEVRLKG